LVVTVLVSANAGVAITPVEMAMVMVLI